MTPNLLFYNHMPLAQIKPALLSGFFERALKFTIERHPYEKAVSQAYFRWSGFQRNEGIAYEITFDKTVRRGKYRNFDLYTLDGAIAIDEVIQFENLESDLTRIRDRLGIEALPKPPKAKAGFRLDKRPASVILTDHQKQTVYDICKDEFLTFGYRR